MSVDRRDSPAAPDGGASYPSLRGRSVFITGGGSGIGGCLTEAFARQGSLVAFVDYRRSALAGTGPRRSRRRACRAPGIARRMSPMSRPCRRAIRDAASAMGDFHVLINNVASDDRHSLMDVTPGVLRRAHRGEPAPGVLRDPGRGARHEEDGRRIDHQLRLEFLRRQGPQHVGVHHREVVGHRPHARARGRTRRTSHPRQCDHARLDHDAATDRQMAHARRRARDQAQPGTARQGAAGRRRAAWRCSSLRTTRAPVRRRNTSSTRGGYETSAVQRWRAHTRRARRRPRARCCRWRASRPPINSHARP